MPETSPPIWRKVLEGVTVAIAVAVLLSLGAAAMTLPTVYSAYLSGKPFYTVAPYISAVFCLSLIGLYFGWRGWERFQSYLVTNRLSWLSAVAESDRQTIH